MLADVPAYRATPGPYTPPMAAEHSMRRAAWQAVRGFAERGWRIGLSLDRIHEVARLEPRDRAAAASLASVCVRRRASLDAVLTHYIRRPRGEMENDLWLLAQVGLAQLAFRPDIPPRAAIHATVEVAREVNAERWVGLLNGTLRTLSTAFERQDSCDDKSRAIADESTGGWLVFDRPVITDSAAGKRESKRYSLPRWLVRRWTERFGDDAASLMRASNIDAGMWLRCRPGTRDEVLAAVAEAGHEATPGDLAESVWLPQAIPLMGLEPFRDGRCSVQNLTAMRAVDLLGPQPGETVLDLCAAPGGKTGMIAERLRGEGQVIAADSDERRLPRIAENVERLGVANVEVRHVAREGGNMPEPGTVDAALVDVPCSNTGVLAKRPEARWRIGPDDLIELPPIQSGLLARAAASVRPGGRVVYSTCSIEPEENAAIVQAFLEGHPQWSLADDALTRPDGRVDGGYRALLTSS